jgi:hypothetical protein
MPIHYLRLIRMESLRDLLTDIHVLLRSGMSSLPLTIGGTMLLLGLCTANYAILFFLVGFLILIPALVGGLNMLAEWMPWDSCKMGFHDVCRVVIPFYGNDSPPVLRGSDPTKEEYIVLTPWMTMMAFFLGYILQNAAVLYTRESSEVPIDEMVSGPDDIKGKTVTRKTQAIISLVTISVFIVIVLKYRYDTECEGILRILGASVVGGLLGVGWYSLLRETGQDRLSDLFGIANRLLPPGALANKPLACLPESCM